MPKAVSCGWRALLIVGLVLVGVLIAIGVGRNRTVSTAIMARWSRALCRVVGYGLPCTAIRIRHRVIGGQSYFLVGYFLYRRRLSDPLSGQAGSRRNGLCSVGCVGGSVRHLFGAAATMALAKPLNN
ncbi:MAG: hypothetical protein R3F37_17455 [Candidatus Competibacteraceae bacterium]